MSDTPAAHTPLPTPRLVCAFVALLSGCGQPPPPVVVPVASAVTAAPPPLECAKGTADCDGKSENACEVETDFDDETCGACDVRCSAGERCVFGSCRRTGALTVGADHSCALTGDGGARCWGIATGGALGDGSDVSTVMRTGAVRPTGLADVVSVAAGGPWVDGATSCALMRDGQVSCWGHGAAKRPGLEDGWKDVVDVAVTTGRLCGVMRDGSVTCKSLGRARSMEGPSLTRVAGLTDAVQVCTSHGYSYDEKLAHTCALRRTGQVKCWGTEEAAADWEGVDPIEGGLVAGDAPALTNAVQISCGSAHDCALRSNGQIHCWGRDRFGGLGKEHREPLTGLVEVAAGEDHTCALGKNGRVWCWGRGADGQLGNGSGASSRTPVAVSGITDAVHIGAGESFSCAARKGGATACWGERQKLGDAHDPSPRVISGITGATSVRIASGLLCTFHGKDEVRCLRPPSGAESPLLPRQGPSFQGVTSIPMTDDPDMTFCVLRKDKAACYDYPYSSTTSWALAGVGPVKSVLIGDTGKKTGFALLASGSVSALTLPERGDDASGDLKVTAAPVKGLTSVKAIAGSWNSACALLRSGGVTCVRIAPGSGGKAEVRSTETLPIKDATALAGYDSRYVVLHKDGTVSGFELREDEPISGAVKIGGVAGAVEIATGHLFACARLGSGEVECWGDNFSGELGTGDFVQWEGAMRVVGLSDAIAIDAGSRSACAVRKDGTVVCWGEGIESPHAIWYPVPVMDDKGPPAR